MENELINAEDICMHYQIEYSFIQDLQQAGLIQITTVEQRSFIEPAQLHDVESMIRLHYDLNINLEGIEAIRHLLERVKTLQQQVAQLRSRLHLYEDSASTH